MKLKLKSNSLRTMHIGIYAKIAEGWHVIKEPKKNWWGNWICKLEKK